MTKNIKILVACHKPSELPKNPLFAPIQVGSALAKNQMDILHDDTGDNISTKNPTYCELTAQYWAWKNLNADYYGLCHYRRFLCFKKTDIKRNRRDQIEASILNSYNIKRFGLEDEAEMRKVIEQNDVVVGKNQDVRRLYTPRGPQSTAYKHWVAHDRALIMKKDLDLMLDTLSEVSPEIGASAKEYLATNEFLGFNCFVMKKELFDKMCSIEFEALKRLEEKVDLTSYCQQLTRIYGFMGEIISSSFIYHIEQSGKYKIKHVPLVYFDYTDPIQELKPEFAKSKKAIPILFNHADSASFKFGVIWQSFLEHIDENYEYDVILLSEADKLQRITFTNMAKKFPNISLRFIDARMLRCYYKDLYDLENPRKNIKQDPEDISNHFSILPFLPFILPDYERILVFDENNLFLDSIIRLWEDYGATRSLIAAPNHVYIQARINDVYYETLERHLSKVMKKPLSFFSLNAAIWNLDKMRETFTEEQITNLYLLPNVANDYRSKEEIMNILCESDTEKIDQRWGTWLTSNEFVLKFQLPYAPLQTYQELQKAQKNPGIITYMANDPWDNNYTEIYQEFWRLARKTDFYELCLERGMDLVSWRQSHQKSNMLDALFPVDSKARAQITRLLPHDSQREKIVKNILRTLHLR